jgi:hypothetical protein
LYKNFLGAYPNEVITRVKGNFWLNTSENFPVVSAIVPILVPLMVILAEERTFIAFSYYPTAEQQRSV